MRSGSMLFLLSILMLMSVGIMFIIFFIDGMQYNEQVEYEADHEQPMFKITSQNYTDWSNSTIEINMSYIKQVRYENNTMMISIRKGLK